MSGSTMTDDAAFSVISQIAQADYDSDVERPTREFARRSIGLARQPGHCRIDGAIEAIEHLGTESAIDLYIDSWQQCHEDEFSDDEGED